MVICSSPTPMAAMKRHESTDSAVDCKAIAAVASEYQTSEKVKIERRPRRSAMKPNPMQPTHMPANVQKTKKPTPRGSKNPAGVPVNSPPETSPGVMYAVRNKSYNSKMPPSEIRTTKRHSVRVNGSRSSLAATSPA